MKRFLIIFFALLALPIFSKQLTVLGITPGMTIEEAEKQPAIQDVAREKINGVYSYTVMQDRKTPAYSIIILESGGFVLGLEAICNYEFEPIKSAYISDYGDPRFSGYDSEGFPVSKWEDENFIVELSSLPTKTSRIAVLKIYKNYNNE